MNAIIDEVNLQICDTRRPSSTCWHIGTWSILAFSNFLLSDACTRGASINISWKITRHRAGVVPICSYCYIFDFLLPSNKISTTILLCIIFDLRNSQNEWIELFLRNSVDAALFLRGITPHSENILLMIESYRCTDILHLPVARWVPVPLRKSLDDCNNFRSRHWRKQH